MTIPTPLVERASFGGFTVHAIQAGGLKLDGGAMFGVIPKPLWERRLPADERNRIQFGMRCLLVEHPDGLVLIDTGAGNKETDKFYEIYGVENAGREGRTLLEDGIRAAGFTTDDVAFVINTHLHFDHAGGNTYKDASGAVKLTFPRAAYIVQRGEYRFALHTNERTAASYFPPNFRAVYESGRMDLVEGEQEIMAGITVIPTPGHTPHHQSILLGSGPEALLYLADLAPTAAHLPLPWIMGYDVEPLVTLETKRAIFARAMAEGWTLGFEHDASTAWGRLAHDGKQYHLAEPSPAAG